MNIIYITANLICGICLGLYFQNMALFILIIYSIFILVLSLKNKRILILGFIICLTFYFFSYETDKKYESLFLDGQNISGILKIVSSKEAKQYKNKYIAEFEGCKFIIYSDKKDNFEYGDILEFYGNFENANSSKNFNSFNYSRYLRQQKIYGILNLEYSKKNGKEKDFWYYLEVLKIKLKKNLYSSFSTEKAGFLAGLLIGDKSEVLDETIDDFRNSSLSHILALSGLHIVYVSYFASFLLNLITTRQRLKNFLMILILVFFAIFTGASPSCIRACIMTSMVFLSKVVYRKNDLITSFLISLDIILIINCYNIESIGMWLSFFATFGLIYINFSNTTKTEEFNFKVKIKNKILSTIKTCISCNIMIIPIIWNSYNTVSLTFLVSNFLSSFFIGPIIILGYMNLFLGKLFPPFLENIFLNILFNIAKIIGSLKFSKIFVPSCPIIIWVVYYVFVLMFVYYRKTNSLKKFIYYFKKFKYYIIILLVITVGFTIFKTQDLEIHFLDVGQGDCSLIITPSKQKILIDGGNNDGFDYGEKVVMPYLLKNRIFKIDYIIVSHRRF